MYKRVDEVEQEELQGYSYRNRSGNLEYVDISGRGDSLAIMTDEYEDVRIYYEDTPKLINALQSAYDAEMARRDEEFIKVGKTMSKEN